MTTEIVAIGEECFEPVQVSEETLEGLLMAVGDALFSGLRYFPFRPAIPSRWGTRHPDGALLAPGCSQWWVVEIELHSHDFERHVMPQLTGLADGTYGWQSFEYLERAGLNPADYANLDVWEPSFLLIVDHLTPLFRTASTRSAFEVLECATFRSPQNRYALGAKGFRPSIPSEPLPGGLDVRLDEASGVALLIPIDRRLPRNLPDAVLVGERQARIRRTSDRDAIVLPLSAATVEESAGRADRYRLTADDRLIPAHTKR